MTLPPNTLRDIEDLPDVGIEMPDQCRLSARIWRPANVAAIHCLKSLDAVIGTGPDHRVHRMDEVRPLRWRRDRRPTQPDNPLPTFEFCNLKQEIEQDEYVKSTASDTGMWANHEEFHLSVMLTAYENENLVFSKSLEENIPRHQI